MTTNKHPVQRPESHISLAQSTLWRKEILDWLVAAYHEDEEWTDLSEVPGVGYVKQISSSLLRLGLIETKMERGKLMGKITQMGLWAAANGRYKYWQMKRRMVMPVELFMRLEEIAKDLELGDKQGRGGVTKVMRAVAGKGEAFKRWVKAVYAREYEEDKDEKERHT